MNILHHDLKSVKTPNLRNLHLSHESLGEVFEDYSVRGSEEGKHHLYEVLLADIKFRPVFLILRQVYLFRHPEASHLLLVHIPNVGILDRKHDVPIWVVCQYRLDLL